MCVLGEGGCNIWFRWITKACSEKSIWASYQLYSAYLGSTGVIHLQIAASMHLIINPVVFFFPQKKITVSFFCLGSYYILKPQGGNSTLMLIITILLENANLRCEKTAVPVFCKEHSELDITFREFAHRLQHHLCPLLRLPTVAHSFFQ